jgi:uncharacterized protein YabN with tetrapyrrole methylase and pyrophosphatase domain
MRRSTEILYASDAIGIADYLHGLCGKVTEVYVSTLREKQERLSKYNRIAAMVTEAALDRPPVSFAIPGHPLVFVYPTQQILAVADQLGLRVKVVPGISSFDCMIVDLQLDPGSGGVQMYYPAAHKAKVVYSSSHPLATSTILEFRIDEMHLHAEQIHPGATLYLPPARLTEVKDLELAKLVDSVDH